MPTHPLILHTGPDAIVAYRDGVPISARAFLNDVATVAQRLPAVHHVLNACVDRYRFSVTLMAVALAGKINLLPSTLAAQTIFELRRFAPDVVCLTDDVSRRVDLPMLALSDLLSSNPDAPMPSGWHVPSLDTTQVIALVFTSGSTGVPIAHRKTWGSLVQSVKASFDRLEIKAQRTTFIGTVPPQHMYGFESTVLLALQSGGAFEVGRPFYSADIARVIQDTPRPRVLVTTPTHLRSLVASNEDLPAVDLVLSATAPLSSELAREAERRLASTLLEIYGSTETGQIATRRTTRQDAWQLLAGCRVELKDSVAWASGGHIEKPTPMGDILEVLAEGQFLLHGRNADLVNIAGHRTSMGYLNHQLASIEGVEDGVFYMPDDENSGAVTRLAALVVAPGLDRSVLLRALRERIDAVFLPRPLVLVQALPRNETGKLPRQALKALIEDAARVRERKTSATRTEDLPHSSPKAGDSFVFESSHPAFTGHFPGAPVVPGVMLLDESIYRICASLDSAPLQCELISAKFLSPLAPGEFVHLRHRLAGNGMVDFELHASDRMVARGRLRLASGAPST